MPMWSLKQLSQHLWTQSVHFSKKQPLLPPPTLLSKHNSFYEAIGKSMLVLYNGCQFRDNLKYNYEQLESQTCWYSLHKRISIDLQHGGIHLEWIYGDEAIEKAGRRVPRSFWELWSLPCWMILPSPERPCVWVSWVGGTHTLILTIPPFFFFQKKTEK